MWKSTIKSDVNQLWDFVMTFEATMQTGGLFINKRELYLLTRYRNERVIEEEEGEVQEEMVRAAGFCRPHWGLWCMIRFF